MNIKLPSVLKENAAASLLGMSARTMQRMRLDGGGPPYVQLTDRRIGYTETALHDWIRERTVTSTSAATALHMRKSK